MPRFQPNSWEFDVDHPYRFLYRLTDPAPHPPRTGEHGDDEAKLKLCVSGVTGGSALLGTKFEHPLGGWQPTLEIAGTFISDRDEEWPHFYGTSLFPEIVVIEDMNDDQRRVTFKATATGESLLKGQQLTVESTRWSVAVKPDRNVEVGESDVVLTRADVER